MPGVIYNITYRTFQSDGEPYEEVTEVRAHSETQAIFLAPCNPEDILYIECAVVKNRVASY